MWETLRKFGLGYCDLPSQIWCVAVMLWTLAVKIEPAAKPIPKILYVLNVVCTVSYLFTYQVSMACFVFVSCRQTGDTLAGILVLSVSLTSFIGIAKLICMYIYQRLDQNFTDRMTGCSRQEVFRDNVQSAVAGYIAYDRFPCEPSAAEVLATTMRAVKKRTMLFWGTMMGNGFIYNLQPLLMPEQLDLYDAHVIFGLKYIFGSSNYLLVLINIVISAASICFIVSNITCFLIITAGYSEGRMLALSQEMRELWSDAHRHYRTNFDSKHTEDTLSKSAAKELNNYVKRRLDIIVQSHAMNIDLVQKIEIIFRNAVAIEFMLLTAALIGDLLGGLEQTFIILPFALMQVTMDCYIGQKLMDASLVFENAVYDCKWENFDVHNRKTMLCILKMSQKTMFLTAGGVATLNFGSLMVLYKSVYSAYAALRTTME